jgi:hypothetical protein
MGYDTATLRIPLRLDNHLGPETQRDRDAMDLLRHEIQSLIDSDPEYSRIAILGVEG